MTLVTATEAQTENTTEQGQSYGHASANQTDNNESNLESRTPIQDSPFILVKQDGKNFVTLAQYQLTPSRETAEEALNDIQAATWHTLINVFDAMMNIRAEIVQKGAEIQ